MPRAASSSSAAGAKKKKAKKRKVEVVLDEQLGHKLADIVSKDRVFSHYYRIVDYIGRGEHAVVFTGQALKGKDSVCVKIELQQGGGSLALLQMEQRTLATFKPQNSKHLLKMRDCFWNIAYPDEDGFRINVLVTDLYGDSLQQWIDEQKEEWTPASVVHVCRQVIDCMADAHAQEIVHRDIRADNFCVDRTTTTTTTGKGKGNGNGAPTVYLIDFGLAQRHEFLERDFRLNRREAVVVGSEPYPSWRAALCEYQSYRDDMESVAFMFWRWLTGSLPWEAAAATSEADIARLKEQAPTTAPAAGLQKFLEHCRSLKHGQRPDYAYLKRLCETFRTGAGSSNSSNSSSSRATSAAKSGGSGSRRRAATPAKKSAAATSKRRRVLQETMVNDADEAEDGGDDGDDGSDGGASDEEEKVVTAVATRGSSSSSTKEKKKAAKGKRSRTTSEQENMELRAVVKDLKTRLEVLEAASVASASVAGGDSDDDDEEEEDDDSEVEVEVVAAAKKQRLHRPRAVRRSTRKVGGTTSNTHGS